VVEPDSAALNARRTAAEEARARGEPTVPSTLAEELDTNPFLRSDDPVVVAAASDFAGQALKDPVEVFATVRHWKDTLD
jgi:hydroxyacylglutathione hydrolase